MNAIQLSRDTTGQLTYIDARGNSHAGVEAVRAFPITDPDRWISLLDSRGKELVTIEDLSSLAPEISVLLQQELNEREFLPQIQQVIRVRSNKEPHQWQVLTDRGPVQFLMRDDDIRRLGPNRAILVDMHGVRYYIADSTALDKHSRRILSRYL